MKILITGVNGFVGRALYKQLSKTYEAIGIGRRIDTEDEMLKSVDLKDEKTTITFFEQYEAGEINTIIHLASRIANKDNINDLSVISDNTVIAKNIALAAKRFAVKHIIHISSSSVYPNITGVFNEESVPDPSQNSDCIYGLSKFNSEIALNYFTGGELIITHLRTAMIHGPGMDESRIIPILLKEIDLQNSATLFGNGERLLNLIHIDKLVEIITYFINRPKSGIFNTGEECVTLIDLAKDLIMSAGKPQTEVILKPQGNRSKFELDVSKLTAFINAEKDL